MAYKSHWSNNLTIVSRLRAHPYRGFELKIGRQIKKKKEKGEEIILTLIKTTFQYFLLLKSLSMAYRSQWYKILTIVSRPTAQP